MSSEWNYTDPVGAVLDDCIGTTQVEILLDVARDLFDSAEIEPYREDQRQQTDKK